MDVIFKSQDAVVTGGLVPMPDGVSLYTLIARPKSGETFPIVLFRTPYDAADSVEKVARELAFSDWLSAGFAVVRQHCRGRGLSEGECHPYHEREDGLATHDFIRTLPFYGGEIYLAGGSYLATVHLACATGFGDDIRGAVLWIQTDRMYFRNYRNGCCYHLCNLPWWLGMLSRRYPDMAKDVPITRPYIDVMERIVGEDVPDYRANLEHIENDEFWTSDPRNFAAESLRIPVLFAEGWYDFYIEGMFDMWERLPAETRAKSAMLVGPWGHATSVSKRAAYPLTNGNIPDDFSVRWCKAIHEGTPPPWAPGKVHSYSIGGDTWVTDGQDTVPYRLYFGDHRLHDLPTDSGAISWRYDPSVRVGCFPFHDIFRAAEPGAIDGVVSFVSDASICERRFYGMVKFSLTVASDCEDTAFFMRLYFVVNGAAYNLTETITSLSHVYPEYHPGERVTLALETPMIGFTLKPGAALRVDISSDGGIYTPHANIRGHFAHVTEEKVANNTIFPAESYMELCEL